MPTHIVYVSCAIDQHITVLEFDPASGALRERARIPCTGTNAANAGSLPLALSPDRTRLYAALRAEPWPLLTFAIDPTNGALSLLATSRLPDNMCHLATDTTGRTLFSASYSGAKLATNPIDPHGHAGPPMQTLATPPKAHSSLIDPANRFLYAASLGGDAILCQAFDATTGRLAPDIHIAARTKAGAGPRHLAFGHGGRALYVVNELDGTVNTYARNPDNGALTELQSLSLLPAATPLPVAAADIHLTPDNCFLYASERRTHTISGFAIDPASFTLTPVCRVPSPTTPRGFAIDPTGRHLLCAGLGSGKLDTFAIEPAGTLVRVGSHAVGRGPNWIEIT